MLDKYYVGELVTNEVPVFPRPGYVHMRSQFIVSSISRVYRECVSLFRKFYKTLKERVYQHFKENNIVSCWLYQHVVQTCCISNNRGLTFLFTAGSQN